MEKQNYSQKQSESQKKPKKEGKSTKDLCPVCDEDLYLDATFTQRVGLIDGDDDVYGWMCPYCRSEFDVDGDIRRIFRDGKIQGNA
jgi:hypothetical protein|tara:strand:- start:1230 stop:1487 length:258 start_codon:yes stop_codon:yes gene_type:complete